MRTKVCFTILQKLTITSSPLLYRGYILIYKMCAQQFAPSTLTCLLINPYSNLKLNKKSVISSIFYLESKLEKCDAFGLLLLRVWHVPLTAPLCDSFSELTRVNSRKSMRGSIFNYPCAYLLHWYTRTP